MATRELITQAEYARRRGVSQAAVSKAVDRCHIPLVDGKLDPLVADVLWKARTDPHQQARALGQQRSSAIPGPDLEPIDTSWRARREKAEAQLAELELQERDGTLVKKEEVERAAKRLASAIVQQLASIPDRIAAEFGVDDEQRRKLRFRLREDLDQVRSEFARAGMLGAQ